MRPNSLQKFQQTSVGSKGRIIDYAAKISPSGDLQKLTDLQVILTSWNNILTTPLRSYTFDPAYGSNLYKYVFDPADETTSQKIEDEVRYRLNSFDLDMKGTRQGYIFFTSNITLLGIKVVLPTSSISPSFNE